MPLPRSCGGCQRDLVWKASHAPDCVHVQQEDEAEYHDQPNLYKESSKNAAGPQAGLRAQTHRHPNCPHTDARSSRKFHIGVYSYITRTKV